MLPKEWFYRTVAPLWLALLAIAGCDRAPDSSGSPAILPHGARLPDIVFLLIDTLRADRLGVYGHKGELTPSYDALAREGVVFERCFSVAPWTLPSTASLFTGYYPGVHKATDYREVESARKDRRAVSVLSDDFQTLAEILHAAGYQTAAFVANPFLQAEYGFSQGFEVYQAGVRENGYKGSDLNRDVFAWLDQRDATRPLFLYVHYMDPHGPYDAPPELIDPLIRRVDANPNKRALDARQRQALHPQSYLRKTPPGGIDAYNRLQGYQDYWIAGYEACVQESDLHVGDLFGELRRRGLWDRSYVILTSDHGEAFAEHGYWEHGPGQHQHQLHVPLILRWPGVLPAGRRVADNVRTIDILPTIMEQLRLTADNPTQGESLVKHIAGDRTRKTIVPFAEASKWLHLRQEAIVSGNSKLLRTTAGAMNRETGEITFGPPTHQLFDIAADPGETSDLLNKRTDTARQLIALMDEQLHANAQTRPGVVSRLVTMDPRIDQAVGALGYAHDPAPDDPPPDPANDGSATGTGAPAPKPVPLAPPVRP